MGTDKKLELGMNGHKGTQRSQRIGKATVCSLRSFVAEPFGSGVGNFLLIRVIRVIRGWLVLPHSGFGSAASFCFHSAACAGLPQAQEVDGSHYRCHSRPVKAHQEFEINYFQDEDGIFTAQVPAIRGCVAWGKTLQQCHRNAVDAIESCLEAREKVAAKKSRQRRYARLNVYRRPVHA